MKRRRGAKRAAALLATAGLALLTTAGVDRRAAQANNEANRLYEAGKFEDAHARYEEAEQRAPDAAEILYNRGNAALQLGQPAEAASYLRRAAEGGDPALRERSFYNLGNALHASGDFPGAAEAYRRALLLDPGDRDAKINYEKVLRDQERNPEQQQQQQQQQNNQQQDPQQQQQGPQQGPRGQQGNEQEQGEEQQQQQGDEQGRPEEKPEDTPPEPSESRGDSPPERRQQAATAGVDSVAPGDLSREEALRILEALREQEKELQKERARKKAATRRVEKDW